MGEVFGCAIRLQLLPPFDLVKPPALFKQWGFQPLEINCWSSWVILQQAEDVDASPNGGLVDREPIPFHAYFVKNGVDEVVLYRGFDDVLVE